MQLGAFSISLAVKDLAASRAFYEKLGFSVSAGDPAQNWLILRNGAHVIGLFQGMFDRNILTFNPGWDQRAQPLESFTDVRELQRRLKGERHPDLRHPLLALGTLLLDTGRPAEAIEPIEQAVALARELARSAGEGADPSGFIRDGERLLAQARAEAEP